MSNPKGNPQYLKPAVKGGPSPNPKGRPPDQMTKRLKALTANEFSDVASLILKGDIGKVKAIAQSTTEPAFKVAIAALFIKALQKGDMHAFDKLLDRMIGKVKQQVDVSAEGGFKVIVKDYTSLKDVVPANVIQSIAENTSETLEIENKIAIEASKNV